MEYEELEKLQKELDKTEEDRKAMAAEIRRLHGVCRDLEKAVRSRTVWVVASEANPNDFTDKYGDTARPDREIIGIFADEDTARKKQEELINGNAHEVICFDCDEIDVTIEEMEVQF